MNVVYAATRNLYEQMMPSIRSLLDHNRLETLYLVIEDDSFPYEIDVNVRILNMSHQTYFGPGCVNIHTRFTYMAMLRAVYADFLDCDRVISLDCDTIVNDSLLPIWEMDLEGKWFAAALEPYKTMLYRHSYFNLGVAVFNLAQMRKDEAVSKLIEILNRDQLPFVDQDALSSFYEKAVEMPCRYNETAFTGMTDNPAIVHYAAVPDWYTDRSVHRSEYLWRYKE